MELRRTHGLSPEGFGLYAGKPVQVKVGNTVTTEPVPEWHSKDYGDRMAPPDKGPPRPLARRWDWRAQPDPTDGPFTRTVKEGFRLADPEEHSLYGIPDTAFRVARAWLAGEKTRLAAATAARLEARQTPAVPRAKTATGEFDPE